MPSLNLHGTSLNFFMTLSHKTPCTSSEFFGAACCWDPAAVHKGPHQRKGEGPGPQSRRGSQRTASANLPVM